MRQELSDAMSSPQLDQCSGYVLMPYPTDSVNEPPARSYRYPCIHIETTLLCIGPIELSEGSGALYIPRHCSDAVIFCLPFLLHHGSPRNQQHTWR